MFSARIADYLLDHGWVTPSQIEEARRTQGFFGGQLESHLLKLGYVSEAVLGQALTEVAGVPFASWDHLRAVPPAAIEALPDRVVERHRVCPFRLDEGRLRVATLNPRDAVALKEIQAAAGLPVEPWITTEPRLYQAIERYYRIHFEGTKGIALAPESASRPPSKPKPRPEDAPRSEAGAEPEFGLDGRPLDAEVSFDEYFSRPESPRAEAAPSALPPPPAREARRGAAPEIADLDRGLAHATSRDEIAAALFSYCASRARRVGLFAVGRDGVRGIAGTGRAFDTVRLKGVAVPPRSGTVFDTALQSRDFYFGVVPALPANRDLYTALGGRLPANVMILPVVVKERTVALIYLDGDDGPMVHPDIPTMRRVAAKTGLAFEMLLLRMKIAEI